MFKQYVLQFGIIPTYEFLYLIRNHATGAIKAIVHTVNMKFRKLKKNNVSNTNKTRQLQTTYESKISFFRKNAITILQQIFLDSTRRIHRLQNWCSTATVFTKLINSSQPQTYSENRHICDSYEWLLWLVYSASGSVNFQTKVEYLGYA